jgi:hypothetical protein
MDMSDVEKCENIIMGNDFNLIISCLPENDKIETDYIIINLILKFLLSLSDNIDPPTQVCDYDTRRTRTTKMFNRVKDSGILDILFRLFKKYSNPQYLIYLSSIIGSFFNCQNISSELLEIIKFMKLKIEEYTKKNTISTNDIIIIFNSLRRNSRIKSSKKYLVELGFSSILLDILKTNDLTVIQYSLLIFGNISLSFSSEVSEQLIKTNNAFDVFSKLFKRLTFITSTVYSLYSGLASGLQVVQKLVETNSPSSNILINHELIKDIIGMLPIASFLSTCTPLCENINFILIHIEAIVEFSSKDIKNVRKLFNLDCVQFFFKSFETLVNERLKGRSEFDEILFWISSLFKLWTAVGADNPTDDGKNALFSKFQEINALETLSNHFTIIKSINLPSEGLKDCLSNIGMFVCLLFVNQTPPLSCGNILNDCFELTKIDDDMKSYWEKMINAEDVLNKWKKK